MPGGSIYVSRDDKLDGTEQWNYEKLWAEAREARLKRRGVIAGVGFVCGILLAIRFSLNPFWMALLGGLAAAGADFYLAWRAHESTAVWRGKRRGEVLTGRLLRRTLARRGYRVLAGRSIPGKASIDHLVIGPGGMWVIDNEAWAPDTEIARYGSKLFLGERTGGKVAEELIKVADELSDLLEQETGVPVRADALLAVHGGRITDGEEARGVVVAEGITVLYPRRIARWIMSHPNDELSDEQVELLARTAARVLRHA
ncbi:nuclease-related domain-containing protein [Thermopolyspora sp. NPDC052614]|uniref:nuclease-related domain-containing protein n=1 Tax=Thermopolyspora sp. NPDC052614 TaxID=3155682 RepID=UPI003449EB0D